MRLTAKHFPQHLMLLWVKMDDGLMGKDGRWNLCVSPGFIAVTEHGVTWGLSSQHFLNALDSEL